MNFIKQIKSIGILFGVISLVVGIVLATKPVQTEMLLNTVVGVGLIVMGIINMIQFFIKKKEEEHPAILIAVPLLITILGIFILINSNVTMFTTGIIISIFAFLLAFDRFMVAYSNKKLKKPIGGTVIFGIIHLIFGSLMLWNVFATMTAIVMMTGIYLIINGIMVISSVIFLKDLK